MRLTEHDERLGLRIPSSELRRIRLAADACGLSVSEFVREATSTYIDVLPPERQPPVRTAPRKRPGT